MLYSHCPKCGTKYKENEESTVLKCSSCNFTFYLNSKPTASALIIRDDSVLLGKRSIEPYKGQWDVIGGFLELGEHPQEGAKREAKEETGYDIKIDKVLGFFMDIYQTTNDWTLNICFLCSVVGGSPLPGDDIEELQWFPADALPETIAFKNGRDMLDAWLKTR